MLKDDLMEWFENPVTKEFVEHCFTMAKRSQPAPFKPGMSMDDYAAQRLKHEGYNLGLGELVTFFKKHRAPILTEKDRKDRARALRRKEEDNKPKKDKLRIISDYNW